MGLLFFIYAILSLTDGQRNDAKPEQIHIAYTGVSTERIINYVTILDRLNSSSWSESRGIHLL